MKILVIPDLHGKTIWTMVADVHMYDLIIFLGDYCDDYTKTDIQITECLEGVIAFKKANMDKVVLLLGNHDIQYMYSYKEFGCSGYRHNMYPVWSLIFRENHKLFKVAHQYKNYLFTHAGVSRGWITKYGDLLHSMPADTLADKLNMLQYTKDHDKLHIVGQGRGGYAEYGGITWADKHETINSHLPNYHQIIGHSKVGKPTRWLYADGSSNTYVDCLDKLAQFLVIEDVDGEVDMKMNVINSFIPTLIDLLTLEY